MHTLKKVAAAYYNIIITYESYLIDIVLKVSLQKSLLATLPLPNYKHGFSETLFLWIAISLVIFTDLAKRHLILKNQYVRHLVLKNQYVSRFISLRYICRNEFSFTRMILNM